MFDELKARKALEAMARNACDYGRYHVLAFAHSNMMTRAPESATLKLLHDDFEFEGRRMFTHDEALELERIARPLNMRLPKAREWGGIAFFISHDDLVSFDLSKFDLSRDGYLWDGTPFKQEEGSSTFYWTGSGDYGAEHARAIHIVPGKFDILSRPASQSMNLKFLIDF